MSLTPAIVLHMLLVWGWAWFRLREPLSLTLWLGPGLCVLRLSLTVKGAWGAFTRQRSSEMGGSARRPSLWKPLESKSPLALSSVPWYLCWVESPFIAPCIPPASVPMRHDPLDPPCCVAESQQRWLSLLRSGQVLATGILEQGSVAGYSGPFRTS